MTPVSLAMAISAQTGETSAPRDRVFISRVDQTEQRYVELRPADFDAGHDHHLLIALHGHGSDRWQCINSEYVEFAAARDVAAKHDMVYVSPDYRATTSWMGPAAEADLLQIIDELADRYRVGKVFLTGASMGGASVLTFAGLHPEWVAGVCSQNGLANHLEYENFQDAIAASFGGGKGEVPDEYRRRSAELQADALTMPVAIAAGGKDEAVPDASVMRLAKELQARGRPVHVLCHPEGGHSTSYEDTVAGLEFVIGRALGTGE